MSIGDLNLLPKSRVSVMLLGYINFWAPKIRQRLFEPYLSLYWTAMVLLSRRILFLQQVATCLFLLSLSLSLSTFSYCSQFLYSSMCYVSICPYIYCLSTSKVHFVIYLDSPWFVALSVLQCGCSFPRFRGCCSPPWSCRFTKWP